MSARFDLSGKNALVTGASRGIGRAIALGFAQEGADVAIASRDTESLEELRRQIEALGRRAYVIATDVMDAGSIAAMAQGAIDQLGSVDILVNNAGGSSYMGPFTTLRFSGWEKTMRLNVDSIVHACQAIGPHMLERGSGSIINVASVASLVGTPELAPYGASKAAVLSLTRTLAIEWGGSGVRVNALCPGWTRTALNADLWGDEQISTAMMERVPLGRWAASEEMVGPAVFLASEAASYLTGQALVVDGGQTAD
ncbi:MAG TPA: SDR family NAD(P)-dependent oxidoreductase [Frankiaceae bacterium]|jgi:NAD(P)-dependent dehydrogenase (short-subunit alcohol dehydrogenase family)|nr:SDR family NAD(P)-dependent oxidoreductase [Frankiaceae bacterium]